MLAAAAAVVLAACGSASSGSSPLGSALSYFPKDSPFVMSVVTDPNAPAVNGLHAMLGRIPFASFGLAALTSHLQQVGINYDTDVRPLFGNPLVVGLDGPGTGGQNKAIAAWVTKDAGALSSLIKKLRLPQAGQHRGATLYQVSNLTLAVDGATLIAANTPALVDAAIDRRAAGGGLTATDFYRSLRGLPRNGLIEVAGNIAPALSSSTSAADALRIPWVAALRRYGIAIIAGSGGLSFRYSLDTGARQLTSAQLPIAPGTSPPGLAGSMPIQFGLRQPAATIAFALGAEHQISPAKYAAALARMNAVKRRTGVDFQRDVLGQMGNSAAIESNGKTFIARVDVNDPAAAARTLRKLGPSALDFFAPHPGTHVTAGPTGFETVHSAHGATVLLGVVDGEFVVGTGTPAQLRAFASAPAAAAPGAQGAAAFRIALPELLHVVVHSQLSSTVRQALSTLGDITGWISSSPQSLRGNATLALK